MELESWNKEKYMDPVDDKVKSMDKYPHLLYRLFLIMVVLLIFSIAYIFISINNHTDNVSPSITAFHAPIFLLPRTHMEVIFVMLHGGAFTGQIFSL